MYDGMLGMETMATILEGQYAIHTKVGDYEGADKVKQDLENIATQYLSVLEQM